MSFLKNMLNGNLKRGPVSDDKTKDKDVDMQPTDLFEGGHKLTALENIGSSLTTLWSSCRLNVISSRENIESQAELSRTILPMKLQRRPMKTQPWLQLVSRSP
ncbi:uncharacterized protein LOC115766422 isoform X2 [Drosophila novamexicana]|uniref:uncharacterized protein LOC115766422 isoform X2 n=1 Tax=Drosophila novamexicana TaxID=47314 RepID=UPI0011E5A780|nr:uncharacterized protein LOC115766422 isoform X2 [Drosophila novamexicana]